MRIAREQLNNMVINYKETGDKRLLDEIARSTIKIIYKFGKSYKVPSSEFNYLFGVALLKSVECWEHDNKACFSTYLTTVIINELKMYLRSKQNKFEGTMLQELEEHSLEQILGTYDENEMLIYEYIVNDTIMRFKNKKTQQALKMYCEGHLVDNIVKELKIGRTSFYYDLKQFKRDLREELEND